MDQPTKGWQELCEAASKELDPKKLISLITEMVKMLDDRHRKSARPSASLHSVGRPPGLASENGVSL
jgi:hypothetical protein